MARLVDAVVDAAPEVLDEGAEEPAVDRSDDEVGVDGEMCGDHGSSVACRVSVSEGRRMRAGYLRLPMESPPCQYLCRVRKAMISGITETSEPRMMMLHRLSPPAAP